MSTDIFNAAREGSLTERAIRQFKLNSGNLDSKDGNGLTLLCTAAMAGHSGVVQRLLDNGAAVNLASNYNCTPLWFATRILEKDDSYKITNELLKRGAQVDTVSDPAMLGTTPLMNALRAGHDLEHGIINLLLAHHAPVDKPSNRNALTEATNLIRNQLYIDRLKNPSAVLSTKESRSSFVSAINTLLGFLVKVVNKFTNNALDKVFGVSGKLDQNAEAPDKQAISAAKFDPVSFNKNVMEHIDQTGLKKFFPADSPFLETVIKKATIMAKKGDSALAAPEYLPGLSKLSLYQPILFVDNSGSMNAGTRIDSMIDICRRMSEIATRLTPDDEGVEVRFLNTGPTEKALYEKYAKAKSPDDVANMVTEAKYKGPTKLGTVLRQEVLQPYIYDALSNEGSLKRPLLISIITDGCPTHEDSNELDKAIIECQTKLKDMGLDNQIVKFQISQIGDDEEANEFLDRLSTDPKIKDYIYVTTGRLDEQFNGLNENEEGLEIWLYKTLAGPILNA